MSSISNSATKIFWLAAAPIDPVIGFLVTQPLADLLALKTYTHGTNIQNYLNIRCFGADPSKGGQVHGSTQAFCCLDGPPNEESLRELKNCENHFYLFKDISEFDQDLMSYELNNKRVKFIHGTKVESGINDGYKLYLCENGLLINDGVEKQVPLYELHAKDRVEFIYVSLDSTPHRDIITGSKPDPNDKYYLRSILPARHALFSGIAMVTSPEEKGTIANIKRIFGGLSGILTPTICIRVDDKDPLFSHLEIDPDFPVHARRTSKYISPNYMGLTGIITQGFTKNLFNRMRNAPTKVALGAARLTTLALVLLASYNYGYLEV